LILFNTPSATTVNWNPSLPHPNELPLTPERNRVCSFDLQVETDKKEQGVSVILAWFLFPLVCIKNISVIHLFHFNVLSPSPLLWPFFSFITTYLAVLYKTSL
jgi:hypothetical protein